MRAAEGEQPGRVRDSKDPGGVTLLLTRSAWSVLVASALSDVE
ncbi:DUF397 domain-containing protein [Actinomadura adrarensis]|uniref:DUF397 domain-containing protein n=1 Tax=Actinomadura adrarensis TaxID=1819600 RepID=A0ABW3CMA7_9ACTN